MVRRWIDVFGAPANLAVCKLRDTPAWLVAYASLDRLTTWTIGLLILQRTQFNCQCSHVIFFANFALQCFLNVDFGVVAGLHDVRQQRWSGSFAHQERGSRPRQLPAVLAIQQQRLLAQHHSTSIDELAVIAYCHRYLFIYLPWLPLHEPEIQLAAQLRLGCRFKYIPQIDLHENIIDRKGTEKPRRIINWRHPK